MIQALKEINYKETSKKNSAVLYTLQDDLVFFWKTVHIQHMLNINHTHVYLIKTIIIAYKQDKIRLLY